MLYSKLMEWGQVVTVIFGIAGFMGIFMFLINKRIDTLEKRFDDVNRRLDKIEEDIRELRQLLYKVLGEPKPQE